MKITVLDGYALNPGDNPWDELAALGEFTCYDRTPPEKIIERAGGSEIVMTNKTVLTREILSALKNLKYVGVLATGFNIVDINAAAELGIPVTNIPTYGTDSVAQLAMAHILEHCHEIRRHSDAVRAGAWCGNPDYSFWNYPLIELAGKTIGIVGFGAIGRRTAKLADAFGMKIIAYDIYHGNMPDYDGFRWGTLEEVFSESDFISLHCPLTPENTGMINEKNIALMKKTAFLVNTARGGLIDEAALAAALDRGDIAGAALDVLSSEPPKAGNPILSAKNATVTPHIAWATLEARTRLMHTAAENVKAFLAGRPVNVVNKEYKK